MTRIASFAHHNSIVNAAFESQRRVSDIQAQIAGKYKSRTYSGIASQSQRLVNLETQLERNDRYLENGKTAKLRLQTMENAIDSMTKLATRLRSLLLQASSGKQARDLDLANQARSMLQTVVTNLNARLDGRYLFAGANTNKPPVDLKRLVTPDQQFANTLLSSASDPLSPRVTQAGKLDINGQKIAYDPKTDSLADVALRINSNETLRKQNITAYVDKTDDGQFRFVLEDADGDKIKLQEDKNGAGDFVGKTQYDRRGAFAQKHRLLRRRPAKADHPSG